MSPQKKIGDILVNHGFIEKAQLLSILAYQNKWGGMLGELLINQQLINEQQFTQALAIQSNKPFVDLLKQTIPQEIIELLPLEYARKHTCIPVRYEKRKTGRDTIYLAMLHPNDLAVIETLQFMLCKTVISVFSSPKDIHFAINKYYIQKFNIKDSNKKVLQHEKSTTKPSTEYQTRSNITKNDPNFSNINSSIAPSLNQDSPFSDLIPLGFKQSKKQESVNPLSRTEDQKTQKSPILSSLNTPSCAVTIQDHDEEILDLKTTIILSEPKQLLGEQDLPPLQHSITQQQTPLHLNISECTEDLFSNNFSDFDIDYEDPFSEKLDTVTPVKHKHQQTLKKEVILPIKAHNDLFDSKAEDEISIETLIPPSFELIISDEAESYNEQNDINTQENSSNIVSSSSINQKSSSRAPFDILHTEMQPNCHFSSSEMHQVSNHMHTRNIHGKNLFAFKKHIPKYEISKHPISEREPFSISEAQEYLTNYARQHHSAKISINTTNNISKASHNPKQVPEDILANRHEQSIKSPLKQQTHCTQNKIPVKLPKSMALHEQVNQVTCREFDSFENSSKIRKRFEAKGFAKYNQDEQDEQDEQYNHYPIYRSSNNNDKQHSPPWSFLTLQPKELKELEIRLKLKKQEQQTVKAHKQKEEQADAQKSFSATSITKLTPEQLRKLAGHLIQNGALTQSDMEIIDQE